MYCATSGYKPRGLQMCLDETVIGIRGILVIRYSSSVLRHDPDRGKPRASNAPRLQRKQQWALPSEMMDRGPLDGTQRIPQNRIGRSPIARTRLLCVRSGYMGVE